MVFVVTTLYVCLIFKKIKKNTSKLLVVLIAYTKNSWKKTTKEMLLVLNYDTTAVLFFI